MTATARTRMLDRMPTSVDRYLRNLDRALVGPARTRHGLLAESRDHLTDATAAYRNAGYTESEAAAMALADFGSVPDVAPSFQTVLAVASARRTALLLLAALSVQPFVWDGPLDPTHGTPDGTLYAVLDVGVEVLGGVALAAAGLMLLATGIGRRWVGDDRLLARATGIVTLAATAALALTGITMSVVARGHLEPLHWVLLLVFLLLPMSATGASARRTLAAA